MTGEQHISPKVMNTLAEVIRRLGNGGLDSNTVAAQLQAILEGTASVGSSLGTSVIEVIDSVEITEEFLAQTMVYQGQLMKRHRNGGGWVPLHQADSADAEGNLPYVAESVYVGPFAQIYGDARVYGYVRVSGHAQIYGDARVYGNAQVSGSALVFGNACVYNIALVFGNARVYGHAEVYRNAEVYGNAEVSGHAQVFGDARVYDNASVYGHARAYGLARVFGNARVFGVAKRSTGNLMIGSLSR